MARSDITQRASEAARQPGQEPSSGGSGSAPARGKGLWVAVPVALVTLLAFAPVVENGFVGLDDRDNIVFNEHFRGLGWSELTWAATTYWLGVYQPLGWLLLSVQYMLWGLDARGYHLVSLLVHTANAVAVFAVIRALLARTRPALWQASPTAVSLCAGLAALLFSAHPMRTEAVAWVSCQSYLPSILFYLLAVLAYLRACGSGHAPDRAGWIITFACFVVALGFKAVAVTVPFALLVLDYYPLRRLGGASGTWFGPGARAAWREKLPLFALSAVFMVLAVRAKAHDNALVPLEQYGLSARLAQMAYAACFYLGETAFPIGITAYYPTPRGVDLLAPKYLACALFVIGMTVLIWLLRKRWPGLPAVWVAYLLILAPNSGLVRIGGVIAANRYCYVAILPWFVLVAYVVCGLIGPGRARRFLGGLVVCIGLAAVAGLVVLSWEQCRVWHDPESLWVHVLRHGGDQSAGVHLGLGLALAEQGRLEAAEAEDREALRLRPDFAEADNNLGLVLAQERRIGEAAGHFAAALELRPDYVEAHANLGAALLHEGRLAEARAQLARALELDPENAAVHGQLGLALAQEGRLDAAVQELAAAVRLRRNDARSHYNLAAALLRQGHPGAAEREYEAALRLQPGSAAAQRGLEEARARSRASRLTGPRPEPPGAR